MTVRFKLFVNLNYLMRRRFSSIILKPTVSDRCLSILHRRLFFPPVYYNTFVRTVHVSKTNLIKNYYVERENLLAHEIMENNCAYTDTVVVHPRKILKSENPDLQKFQRTMKSGTMAINSANLVFLYGTLKQGEPNHHVLTNPQNGSAKYVCKARTQNMWPLVIASRYNIPYLLFQKNTGKHVIGELYEVDDSMLTKLDELECHPKYYERVIEAVEGINDTLKKEYKPWIYFLKNFRSVLLELPCLEDYSSVGNHGLPYVDRYTRPTNVNYYIDVMNV